MSNNDFVLNESDSQSDLQREQVNVNNYVSKLNDFLKTYDSCFTNSIPDELPPPRGVDVLSKSILISLKTSNMTLSL